MATLIPSRNTCLTRMTSGEKRLSERLEEKLEDDYLCWYDVPVGPKRLQPDFVIVHPRRGFLVLEVKDWRLDSIVPDRADRHSVQLYTDRGIVQEKNPLLQARVYALEVKMMLERDPALRNPAGHRYAGKLVMPFGFGAVLSNITRSQFEASGLDQVIETDRVICKDEMLESVEPDVFQQRLWAMFTKPFSCLLSLPQLNRIRWHLFPEIRVNTQVNQFGLFESTDTPKPDIPDLIRVMDLSQESLARSMGDGHRVIHGVAGSGKTMILGYRCLHLAREAGKPILVLCLNITLAARLQQLMKAHGLGDRVVVSHFHGWCRSMLDAYHLEVPRNRGGYDLYTKALVEQTIACVDRGLIPREQYSAVLIDEGHDFEPEWFKLVVQMVDPRRNTMLVLYDDAQAIYSKSERRQFSFASVGIQARGRTTILKLNYRNTLEVLSVARAFAGGLLDEHGTDEDNVPLVKPESAGRRGPMPDFIMTDSTGAQARLIAAQIDDARNHGRSLSDIAIVYRRDHILGEIEQQLNQYGIRYRAASSSDGKRSLFEGEPSVKLVSMHSCKGLEFNTVFIPALDHVPDAESELEDESRLLYVAMTRATDRLIATASKRTKLVNRLEGAIEEITKLLS